ncbi:DUF2550 family protein [Ornithinimicrobium sp. Y1847]|uniref:DUF2550 family protein n=1 Tax=unclassified Ornithinimicrobium TaxID=2615080 RepID=UPI003B678AE0
MPDPLLLVLLVALAGLLILGLGLWLLRRVADADAASAPMPTCFRPGVGDGSWRRGTIRITQDRLALKGPGGLAAGPWVRGDLDLGVAETAVGQDAEQLGREGLITVPVTYQGSTFELALDEQHYTALRAWVEAVPPGWRNPIS